MFNPTVKEFMKEKPDLTIMGLYWAGMWRVSLIVMGIEIFILLLINIMIS